jgi:murein L,D-transpeptidase YcbB/YkuD
MGPPSVGGVLWSAAALDQLERVAEAAPLEGLPAQDVAVAEIDRARRLAARDRAAAAQVDNAADALFLRLAGSLARGAADPAQADPEWRIPPPPEPDLARLRLAVAGGADPAMVLQALKPRSPEYLALRGELARTLAEAPGQLGPDGLDRETRILRLRANMERWRWLPRDMPARRVEVRIAQFQTILYHPDAAPVVHLAIVGARRTPTPTFTADITSITLNPSWEPPSSILQGELLPRFRRDPEAAEREGFEVIGPSGEAVAPTAVDWRTEPFSYRMRQRPGPGNALGQLRFDLPNPYSIYLHDTSNRSLFAAADRALSHGCIRVEDPFDFARLVIDSPEWDLGALEGAIEDHETRTIPLATPTPVYALYFTAAAGADGAVVYFEDLYHRDAAVAAAMDAGEDAVVAAARAETVGCAAQGAP